MSLARAISALRSVLRGHRDSRPGLRFTIAITADPVDGGFVAECLDLPGCMSQGDTEQEALRNISDAIGGVIEARIDAHLAVCAVEELPTAEGVTRERRVAIPVV